jgi:hypothetical protein
MRADSLTLPRVLTTAKARELGLTRKAVAHAAGRRGWTRMTAGAVLTSSGGPTRADWARLGLLLAGPSAALSGWDAVRVLSPRAAAGFPSNPKVLVLTTRGRGRTVGSVRIRVTPRPFGSRIVSAEEFDPAVVRVVTAARAIADTALDSHRLSDVRAMVTTALQRGDCTVGELASELERGPRNDSALLRQALADGADGARSVAEAEALHELRRADVPPFEMNVPIIHGGRLIAVADVLWRRLRAVLEVDSREFHFSEDDWNETMARHNRLSALALSVVHFSPKRIRGGALRREVPSWLRQRARELNVPYPAGVVQPSGGPFVLA